jgi:membrane fusion protein, multidrug efflux system
MPWPDEAVPLCLDPGSMRLKPLLITGAVVGVVALLALVNYVVAPKMIAQAVAEQAPPPPVVTAEPAAPRVMGSSLSGVGTVEAVQGVNVAAEVGGQVREIRFQSGQFVGQGQVLAVLSATTEAADIAAARATLTNAERELARARQLLAQGWTTRATVDQRLAARDAARATVSRAQAETAKRTIRAPFSGRVGLRAINLGQYLDPGQTVVSLQSIDPVYVTVPLPEAALASVKPGQEVRVTVDARPGQSFAGRVTSLDSFVDPGTRTIRVQATLANPEGALTPGMFAQVTVDLPGKRQVVSVPETAVAYALTGDTVWVLSKAKAGDGVHVATPRGVTRGSTEAGRVEILSGVKMGELVATNGQHKLRPGQPVSIDNRLALPARSALPRD